MGGQASGDIIEGVLQVRIGERWGTVCSYGWNVRDSMLACASLGYVMNPSDWRPSWIEAAAVRNRSGSSEHSVILSNVRCVDYDVDIVNCKAERAEDFENSCTHDKDVILRCYRSTWAGIRLGLTAQSSTIRGARIERAGVLDPSLGAFKAALQIDANRHTLEDVAISNNLQSGVEVIFNDFYSDSASRRLRDCEVSGNWAHGVVSRTSGLALDACLVRSNRGHGIFYDPSLEHSKQRELSRWVDRSDGSEVVVVVPGLEANGGQPRNLNRGGSVYVVADGRTPTTGTVAIIEITTGEENVLGIQLLSQVHDGTNDTITVECGKPGDYGYRMLNVREEELHFPIMTTINRVLITYERHQRHGHGDAILYITAVERK